jgi:DNA-binding LacI/PurR family transcriptional regulator
MSFTTQPRNSAGRRIQLSEIAQLAGVSTSTVSRVLNNKADTISEELQRRVLAAVAELNPEQNPVPKSLEHVGLVSSKLMDPSIDPFHTGILAGIEAECRRQGIHFSFTLLKPELETIPYLMDKVKQNHIDGLIFLAVDNRELLEQFLQQDLPAVLVNARHLELPMDTFLPDNQTGTTLVVNHLIKNGHRRIMHVNALDRWTVRLRHLVYRNVLEEAGLVYDPALVLKIASNGANEAYEGMKQFLANNPPDFSAVFCVNDLAAIGVMKALREANLAVPTDISVVGYDDIAIVEFTDPPLTTIKVEREALGVKALKGLLDRAANPKQVPFCLELACQLIERQSVAPVSKLLA